MAVVTRQRFAWLVGAGISVGLGIVGVRTPSDVDEGFYALAAELVAHGRVPYRDFFYPQAPYLPYLLAPFALLGSRLVVERLVLALCCGITGGLVAHAVRRATGSRTAAVTAAVLYAIHELTWQWGPSVRAYGVASLLATGAAVLLSAPPRPSLARCTAAGILVGVMTGARLLLAPAAGALVAAAWLRGAEAPRVRAGVLMALITAVVWAPPAAQAGVMHWAVPLAVLVLAVGRHAAKRAAQGLAAGAGAALALAPAGLLYATDRDRFLFDNLAYHANRVAADVAPAARVPYLHVLFGLPTGVPTNILSALGPQSMLLLAFALAGVLLAKARATVAPLLGAAAMVVAALALVPVMDHYYTTAVPLVAILAGIGMALTADRAGPWTRRAALPAAVLIVCVIVGMPSFHRRWVLGYYNDWDLSPFRPGRIDAGTRAVRSVARTHPGTVLPLWPGSALGLGGRVMPGAENHFARRAPLPENDPAAGARYRVMTSGDLWLAITRRDPAVVAFDREGEHEGGEQLRAHLLACGYRTDAEVPGTVEVFGRDAPAEPACAP